MKKIAVIYGTRPELIKVAPVIRHLKSTGQAKVTVINTGQHSDLLDSVTNFFEVTPDVTFDVMRPGQGLNELLAKLLICFDNHFENAGYDYVVGQGDTTSVVACAISCFHRKIKFAHLEAGLRSHDIQSPFPEEFNRVVASKVAAIHFAPTERSFENLATEGVAKESIVLSGNTVIDSLYYALDHLDTSERSAKKKIFVTIHRRENHGAPLIRICGAIKRIASDFDVTIRLPVHPNPHVKGVLKEELGEVSGIELIEPLAYPQLVSELSECYVILTDSGGIQEEATALKKPVVILRSETERQEVVEIGAGILVGSDAEMIYAVTKKLITEATFYKSMQSDICPFGNGNSSLIVSDRLLGV
jgi:UDP-N-acetylglucosamine 2-epimerase (non-hydrolysing)